MEILPGGGGSMGGKVLPKNTEAVPTTFQVVEGELKPPKEPVNKGTT
jgi:hypothetical protein